MKGRGTVGQGGARAPSGGNIGDRERTPPAASAPAALTARAAAAVLGVSERSVRRAIARGDLPATKRAGSYRITAAALAAYRDQSDVVASDPASLPVALTPFIGRYRERAELWERFVTDGVRLMTLTGPGGVGKTRLAVQVAAGIRDHAQCDVYFVPLDVVDRAERVLPAIAQAVGVLDTGGRPLIDTLARSLGDRRMLLVLDNVEHVVGAARTIAILLARCPSLRILATSRVRLQIDGELEYPLAPLEYPDLDALHEHGPEDVSACPAVELFISRARAVVPAFALDTTNMEAIAGVCARLDGLPLAIELAAPRTKIFAPHELLDHLGPSLALLTVGSVDRPPRHQTLRDAIAWSYNLLTPEDQTLFRRLSVCVGGFTLELASAIAERLQVTAGTASSTALVDVLQRLVDHSLVRSDTASGTERRFAMLETIREYGLEQLEVNGEGDTVRRAHAMAVLDLAERNGRSLFEPVDQRRLQWYAGEQGNVHAALGWLLDRDADRYVALVGAVAWSWLACGCREPDRACLERAVALGEAGPAAARANVLEALGLLLAVGHGKERADPLLQEGLEIVKALGDVAATTNMLIKLGAAANYRGEFVLAEQRILTALDHARSIAEPHLALAAEGGVLRNLGVALQGQGRLREASDRITQSVRLERQAGFDFGVMHGLSDLANVVRDLGETALAIACYRESLHLCRVYGGQRVALAVLDGVATVAAADGDARTAARLVGAVTRWSDITGFLHRVPSDEVAHQRTVTAARMVLGDEVFATERVVGEGWTLEEAAVAAETVLDRCDAKAAREVPVLTAREIEVLHLVARGLTDRAIAEALYISTRTAQNHVTRVNRKLGTSSREAAVASAVAAGFLPAESAAVPSR